MPKCRLCLEDKPLCESHILPEFAYRPTYDEKHAAIAFEPDKRTEVTRYRGYWEPLLCAGCEGRIGKWEDYFARVWFHSDRRPRDLGADAVTMAGLDYRRFKLTLLSIIWRSSVSTLPEFRQVSLRTHEERLRRLFIANDPGPENQYVIAALALRDPESDGFQDGIIALPAGARIAGHNVYKMLFGGVFWFVCVSSHSAGRPVPIALRSDGTLRLVVQEWNQNASVRRMAADMRRYLAASDDPAV
jgi:hypothetical protein